MPTDHSKWANAQVQAAVNLGINILDAQRAVRDFLALLPHGADPDHYIVPSSQLEQDVSDPQYARDALAWWVANENVPNREKLILAAGSGE